ncbi:hypothetical protein K7H91_02280 [Martelella mediterranea]|uniref:hypothetical protein n=1 Tax=Martelella mediterranea TaxID=293089 RepID=UPI001E63E1CE|nr:hypothetical protein [Martelella mediterranea]MCD1632579.1 hypothetical protein [Martelella mediterranea]
MTDKPSGAPPGTSDERPRWEGPEESRPSAYKPAKDDPGKDRDAMRENLDHPRKRDLSDAMKTRRDDRDRPSEGPAEDK